MYLSGYLKQHQMEYYRRLSTVRTEGDWEGWVAFFLEGVAVAAQEAERNIVAVATCWRPTVAGYWHPPRAVAQVTACWRCCP